MIDEQGIILRDTCSATDGLRDVQGQCPAKPGTGAKHSPKQPGQKMIMALLLTAPKFFISRYYLKIFLVSQ